MKKIITSMRNINAFLNEEMLNELGWNDVQDETSVPGLEPKAISSYDDKIYNCDRTALFSRFCRGLASLEQGDPDDALQDFEYLLDLDMSYYLYMSRFDFHFFAGLAYIEIGEFYKGIDHIGKRQGRKETLPDEYYWLGIAYYRLNDFNNAKKYFDLAVKHDPEFEAAYLARCKVHSGLGYLSEVEDDFSKMLELNPDNIEVQSILNLAKGIQEKIQQLLGNIDKEVKHRV